MTVTFCSWWNTIQRTAYLVQHPIHAQQYRKKVDHITQWIKVYPSLLQWGCILLQPEYAEYCNYLQSVHSEITQLLMRAEFRVDLCRNETYEETIALTSQTNPSTKSMIPVWKYLIMWDWHAGSCTARSLAVAMPWFIERDVRSDADLKLFLISCESGKAEETVC